MGVSYLPTLILLPTAWIANLRRPNDRLRLASYPCQLIASLDHSQSGHVAAQPRTLHDEFVCVCFACGSCG